MNIIFTLREGGLADIISTDDIRICHVLLLDMDTADDDLDSREE